MDVENLTLLRDKMTDDWFGSLKVGNKVQNYSLKWQNKQITDKKLREGIIKEIHDNGKFNRYVIVDNLTTGRQNKWNDYDIVKPQELQDIEDQLNQQLSVLTNSETAAASRETDSVNESFVRESYERLIKKAKDLLKSNEVLLGNCAGIYGAFNKHSGECIYIGKSYSSINGRWKEHNRFWKKLRPVHRQPLLTQYLHFFSDQIEWKVLLPVDSEVVNDVVEYCERRLFEQYKPIANTIIPNGTFFGRSVLEGEGESVLVSEWNPYMVTIKIRKGTCIGFSDGTRHFEY